MKNTTPTLEEILKDILNTPYKEKVLGIIPAYEFFENVEKRKEKLTRVTAQTKEKHSIIDTLVEYCKKYNNPEPEITGDSEKTKKILETIYYLLEKDIKLHAKKNPKLQDEVEDLKQQGYLALRTAVMKFNPNYNTTFINYAILNIAGRMKEYLRENDPVPRKVRKAERTNEELKKEISSNEFCNRTPTPEENKEAGITTKEIEKLEITKNIRNIDEPYNQETSSGRDKKIIDLVPDTRKNTGELRREYEEAFWIDIQIYTQNNKIRYHYATALIAKFLLNKNQKEARETNIKDIIPTIEDAINKGYITQDFMKQIEKTKKSPKKIRMSQLLKEIRENPALFQQTKWFGGYGEEPTPKIIPYTNQKYN